jgi:hypothetical protein
MTAWSLLELLPSPSPEQPVRDGQDPERDGQDKVGLRQHLADDVIPIVAQSRQTRAFASNRAADRTIHRISRHHRSGTS